MTDRPEPDRIGHLSRRRFLALGGGTAGAAALGATGWAALVREQATTPVRRATSSTVAATTTTTARGSLGRLLVIVEMAGGNDALNTFVPIDDGRYVTMRPNVGLDADTLVPLAGEPGVGLNPGLAALVPHWERGALSWVQGIGFPDQTRSHFTAMDTWCAGTSAPGHPTGWVGRWLDRTGPAGRPLRAISLGSRWHGFANDTMQATYVSDPGQFSLAVPPSADAELVTAAFVATASPLSSDPAIAATQQAVPAALDAVELLAAAAQGDDDRSALGDPQTATSLLDTAAGIVELDVGTEILAVSISGFDTHADQPANHAHLLTDVANGVDGFLQRMSALGRDDVVVLTVSEFGRRVEDNGTRGTDHGSGGAVLLAGPPVRGGIVGKADLGRLVEGDLAIDLDTRAVYATVLDWLSGERGAALTDEVLGKRYERLDLLAD